MRVRGLKYREEGWQPKGQDVAPHAGAWIEIFPLLWNVIGVQASHPMRVRGLKFKRDNKIFVNNRSHPMRVRGLKFDDGANTYDEAQSHPMRVRGLKFVSKIAVRPKAVSHPMRVRGLKFCSINGNIIGFGRTPCGCVD